MTNEQIPQVNPQDALKSLLAKLEGIGISPKEVMSALAGASDLMFVSRQQPVIQRMLQQATDQILAAQVQGFRQLQNARGDPPQSGDHSSAPTAKATPDDDPMALQRLLDGYVPAASSPEKPTMIPGAPFQLQDLGKQLVPLALAVAEVVKAFKPAAALSPTAMLDAWKPTFDLVGGLMDLQTSVERRVIDRMKATKAQIEGPLEPAAGAPVLVSVTPRPSTLPARQRETIQELLARRYNAGGHKQ